LALFHLDSLKFTVIPGAGFARGICFRIGAEKQQIPDSAFEVICLGLSTLRSQG